MGDNKQSTGNDQRANVKNPNNPAFGADQANRQHQQSNPQPTPPKTGNSGGTKK